MGQDKDRERFYSRVTVVGRTDLTWQNEIITDQIRVA